MLYVHLIDNFTACHYGIDTDPQGGATVLHADAQGYSGIWDTRVRWLWAIAEALRVYESTEHRPPDTLVLCPVKLAELRGFLMSLPGAWPDVKARALADHLAALIADGVVVKVEQASKADLSALLRRGDNAVRHTLTRRATLGLGTTALVANL